MRKESNNQFSDGLINDLNPINTPNTVLTDNLNGTIITYNGNEYSLQNDMGNYKLQNCKLKANYIPVGIKEYGDILYIVSYNPLNEHVEIGSYPAPERIIESDKSDAGTQEIFSLFDNTNYIKTKGNDIYYKYSELIKQSVLSTFYDGDSGSLFLNPGDQFNLKGINDLNLSSVEYIKHFIVDENRRLYDVQWAIDKQNELYGDSDELRNVTWDVPGWLAIKVELANFEEFNVNVRQIKIPALIDYDFNINIDLNFQLKIRDLFLQKNGVADLQNNGYIYLSIKSDKNNDLMSNTTYPVTSLIWEDDVFYEIPLNDPMSQYGYLNWYPDANLYHLNIPNIKTSEISSKLDTITIAAIPVIKVKDKSTPNKCVIYDNFIFRQNVSLNNIGSIDDLNLGNTSFKFWVDKNADDKPELFSIEYNVDGPLTKSSDVNLYYSIWDIQNFKSETRVTPYKRVYGFEGIGSNLMQIPFDKADVIDENNNIIESYSWKDKWKDYVDSKPIELLKEDENVPLDVLNMISNENTSNRFEAESYYMIEFVFAENINDIPYKINGSIDDYDINTYSFKGKSNIRRFYKLIITSDVFNHLNGNSSDFTAVDWISEKIKNHYEESVLSTNDVLIDSDFTIQHSVEDDEDYKKYWETIEQLTNGEIQTASTDLCFFNTSRLNPHQIDIYKNAKFDLLIKNNFITTPLWNQLNKNCLTTIAINGIESENKLYFSDLFIESNAKFEGSYKFTPYWLEKNLIYYDGCLDIESNPEDVYSELNKDVLNMYVRGKNTKDAEIKFIDGSKITINRGSRRLDCRDKNVWKDSIKTVISIIQIEYNGKSDLYSTILGTSDNTIYDWINIAETRYFAGIGVKTHGNHVAFCPIKGYTDYVKFDDKDNQLNNLYNFIKDQLKEVEYVHSIEFKKYKNVFSVSSEPTVSLDLDLTKNVQLKSDIIYDYSLIINQNLTNINSIKLLCDTNMFTFPNPIKNIIKSKEIVLNVSKDQLPTNLNLNDQLSLIIGYIKEINNSTVIKLNNWKNSKTYKDVLEGKPYSGFHVKQESRLSTFLNNNFRNEVTVPEKDEPFFYGGINEKEDTWESHASHGLAKILYCSETI